MFTDSYYVLDIALHFLVVPLHRVCGIFPVCLSAYLSVSTPMCIHVYRVSVSVCVHVSVLVHASEYGSRCLSQPPPPFFFFTTIPLFF